MRRLALLLLLAAPACKKPKPPDANTSANTPAAKTQAAERPTYEAGKAALEAGRIDEAEAIFRAIANAPPKPIAMNDDGVERDNALLGLATLRKERGDARGALGYAQKVVAHRPDDEDALAVVVELAHEAGDLAAEIAARDKLVQLDPDDLEQRLMLAGALTANKDLDKGKAAFLGYEEARVRIITALGKSPEVDVRKAAARALAAAHDAGTARALVLAMTDKDAGVREAAVRAVTQVGLDLDAEIRPALRKLSTVEKDAGVQAALKEALATAAPK
jgi:tetratricopeptide (TPR) repeat protein